MRLVEFLFGRRLTKAQARRERLGPASGLAILGLDALASVAYGPEASDGRFQASRNKCAWMTMTSSMSVSAGATVAARHVITRHVDVSAPGGASAGCV